VFGVSEFSEANITVGRMCCREAPAVMKMMYTVEQRVFKRKCPKTGSSL